MTAVDAIQALAQSIGEHSVQGLGQKHLAGLSVVLNTSDMMCRVVVALRTNTDREQNRALEKLFEVQALFFDDVSMTFDFGHDVELPAEVLDTQRKYSFA